MQMDGKVKKDELLKAIEMGKKAALQVIDIQRAALKEKFGVRK